MTFFKSALLWIWRTVRRIVPDILANALCIAGVMAVWYFSFR